MTDAPRDDSSYDYEGGEYRVHLIRKDRSRCNEERGMPATVGGPWANGSASLHLGAR